MTQLLGYELLGYDLRWTKAPQLTAEEDKSSDSKIFSENLIWNPKRNALEDCADSDTIFF